MEKRENENIDNFISEITYYDNLLSYLHILRNNLHFRLCTARLAMAVPVSL